MSEHRIDPERIAEDEAHRLIARAAELDLARAELVSLTQVRTAAVEAGISPAAFDEALREYRLTLERNTAAISADRDSPPASALGRLRRWFRSRANAGPSSLAARVRVNALALLATWGGMTLLVHAIDLFRVGDGAVTVAMVASLLAGTVLAHRLRANLARFACVALAISIGSEMLFDLIAGHPVVHGNGAQFALLTAGVVGVGVGLLLGTKERTDSSDANAGAQPQVHTAPEPALRASSVTRDPLLVLRPVSGAIGSL